MSDLRIRPMTPDDVAPVAAMYLAQGWGERREYLEWSLANPAIQALVGLRRGAIVATGMAAVNGDVGWVGSIFVDGSLRSRGYGRAMTEAACDLIDAAGCRTQALIASPFGKPLYDRMGFRVVEHYQVLQAGALASPPAPPPGRTLRPIRPGDLPAVFALDRRATGEDRSGLLTSLTGSGWVVESADELHGYLLSILPDFATVTATDPEDAICLLDELRHLAAGRSEVACAAVPASCEAGWRRLEGLGWRPLFQTPRMLRGADIDWEPELIWGILSFGFG
jgi:GNAT superfamily N-acetyltransferase